MDRNTKGRRLGNRNRTAPNASNNRNNRRTALRTALVNRRNRRQGVRRNRNRLARAQNNIQTNRRGPQRRFRRFNNFSRRRNLRLRIVFVGGLPFNVDNRRLYSLFRNEGRIIGCKLVYDRMGKSKGYGFLEFASPRVAWRAIQKWNNTTLDGRKITVEYRKRRRLNRRRFGNNNYSFGNYNRTGFNSYNNYGRYNQKRQGYAFNGRRDGFQAAFRQRRYY